MTIKEINHPLIAHKMGLLREKDITIKAFRELVAEITMLMMYDITADIKTKKKEIECWSGQIEVDAISGKQPTLVPILRAGLGMLTGAINIMPGAKVSVVGLARNEETLEPDVYYENIVSDIEKRTAIVVDPMLATGGTLKATIDMLKKSGCKSIKVLVLLAAPEGIDIIESSHPDVEIYTASIDERLNDKGYILPGLGDAGDKIFGTVM